jgi:cytochrome c biogenesis protein CcmG, thiol:disulfide interchange protein DsbE
MPRWTAIAAVVAATSLVASIVLWGKLHESSLADPQRTADPLAPRALHDPAPDLRGETLAGGTLTLAGLRGRPVVVTFFASWCPPCRRDAPRIAALARRYGSRVAIVGIDGGDTRSGARAFLDRYGWRFPIVWDPSNAQYASFGVAGQPTTYLIDARGMLVERFLGPIDPAVARRVLDRLVRA